MSAVSAGGSVVQLTKNDGAPHLEVNGKPMLILGGELGNSSATCGEDIEKILPKLRRMNLNCVLVPAYWELIEPEEGSLISR